MIGWPACVTGIAVRSRRGALLGQPCSGAASSKVAAGRSCRWGVTYFMLAYSAQTEKRMYWTTPTLVEICIGLEINGYLPAEF
jgi:coenzyme PQQ precursor peptide PqqA